MHEPLFGEVQHPQCDLNAVVEESQWGGEIQAVNAVSVVRNIHVVLLHKLGHNNMWWSVYCFGSISSNGQTTKEMNLAELLCLPCFEFLTEITAMEELHHQ